MCSDPVLERTNIHEAIIEGVDFGEAIVSYADIVKVDNWSTIFRAAQVIKETDLIALEETGRLREGDLNPGTRHPDSGAFLSRGGRPEEWDEYLGQFED